MDPKSLYVVIDVLVCKGVSKKKRVYKKKREGKKKEEEKRRRSKINPDANNMN